MCAQQQAQAQLDEQKASAPAVDANATAIQVTQLQQLQTLQAKAGGFNLMMEENKSHISNSAKSWSEAKCGRASA
ncbi:MAG: hypothetical protein CPDRYMAC_0272 [uncultured Paraburkholderia sp.]|nr:MAG: unnamed protein product [uncultured Paraburkholderia sp.]CAH2910724.1 MAG: hypothetical protein CPDRYMAC_0272 [uncultured Paraburkholderia sp.]